MLRYALVNKNTNVVVNIILWDGESEWSASETHDVINVENVTTVDIGHTHDNGVFTSPIDVQANEVSTPSIDEIQRQLTALQEKIALLTSKT